MTCKAWWLSFLCSLFVLLQCPLILFHFFLLEEDHKALKVMLYLLLSGPTFLDCSDVSFNVYHSSKLFFCIFKPINPVMFWKGGCCNGFTSFFYITATSFLYLSKLFWFTDVLQECADAWMPQAQPASSFFSSLTNSGIGFRFGSKLCVCCGHLCLLCNYCIHVLLLIIM